MASLSGDLAHDGDLPPPESIARNTGFAFVTSVASAAFTAVLTLFLLRALEPAEYGVFALALGIGGPVLLISNLGISHAAARYVAESPGDRAGTTGVVVDAFRLKVLVTGGFCLALAALAPLISAAYDVPELEWPIRIMALSVFAESLVGFYGQLSEARGRQGPYLRVVLFESATEVSASILLVLAGLGVSGAVAGRAGGYLFAAVYACILLFRSLGARPTLGRGAGNARRLLGYGSTLLVVDGAVVLFASIDVLLIGAILDVVAVGEFQAPMRLMAFLALAGAAVSAGVAPRLARGRSGPDADALTKALRRLMIVQGVFIAPLVVWAEPIMTLIAGEEYAASADVMRALAPYAFLIAVSPLLARGVTYLGEGRRRIPIAVGALLIVLTLDLALLPWIGVVGAAIGTDIAYAFYVAGHFSICRQLLGTPVAPQARTFGRVLAAGVAMGAVLFAFGTGELGLPRLVIGGLAGSLAYVVVLFLLRELTREELNWVAQTLRRRRLRVGA